MLLFTIAYVLSVLEGVFALHVMGVINTAVSQLKLSCMVYIVVVIALVMNNRRPIGAAWEKGLAYIGDRSYGVFYVHSFIMSCVTFLLKKVGMLETLPLPITQILQFILVLALSLTAIELAHKIDRKNKLCWLVGF